MTTAEMEAVFDTAGAAVELSTKTAATIERETAFRWAGRAVVAYRIYHRSGELRWRDQAVEYAHEACEHAAMALDGGSTLRVVEDAIANELARLGSAGGG